MLYYDIQSYCHVTITHMYITIVVVIIIIIIIIVSISRSQLYAVNPPHPQTVVTQICTLCIYW